MPTLVDTTIRLLGQEPLAGRMPTAELLRSPRSSTSAGFAYLEVSGGGCFDTAVKRGVESPWERIRALKARTTTPLGLALRGRFLVGSRPVDGDFIRRFVASAAENGIDVFRLHDPLNDVSNLREAAEAIVAAERDFEAGLVYSPGRTGEIETLIEQARSCCRSSAPRACSSTTRRARCSRTAPASSSTRLPRRAGCRSASTARARAATRSRSALEAARAGADLIACAVYPVALTLHRVAGEAPAEDARRASASPGVDVDALWHAADLIDEHIGDEPVTPVAPRIAVRAAEHELPGRASSPRSTRTCARYAAGDRLDEVLDELDRIRAETGAGRRSPRRSGRSSARRRS